MSNRWLSPQLIATPPRTSGAELSARSKSQGNQGARAPTETGSARAGARRRHASHITTAFGLAVLLLSVTAFGVLAWSEKHGGELPSLAQLTQALTAFIDTAPEAQVPHARPVNPNPAASVDAESDSLLQTQRSQMRALQSENSALLERLAKLQSALRENAGAGQNAAPAESAPGAAPVALSSSSSLVR